MGDVRKRGKTTREVRYSENRLDNEGHDLMDGEPHGSGAAPERGRMRQGAGSREREREQGTGGDNGMAMRCGAMRWDAENKTS